MKYVPYIVSEMPKQKNVWYAHHRDFPHIPVFGSIGEKKKALETARIYNEPYRRRNK